MSKLLDEVLEISASKCEIEKKRFENNIKEIDKNIRSCASYGYDKLIIYFDKILEGVENSYLYYLEVKYHEDLVKKLLLDHYDKEGFHVDIGVDYVIISWSSKLHNYLTINSKDGLYYDYSI